MLLSSQAYDEAFLRKFFILPRNHPIKPDHKLQISTKMCFFSAYTGILYSANPPCAFLPFPSREALLGKICNTLARHRCWPLFREPPLAGKGKNRQPTDFRLSLPNKARPYYIYIYIYTRGAVLSSVHTQGVGGHKKEETRSPQQFPRSVRQPIFQDVQGGVHHTLHSPSKKLVEHLQSRLLCSVTGQGWGGGEGDEESKHSSADNISIHLKTPFTKSHQYANLSLSLSLSLPTESRAAVKHRMKVVIL